MKNEYNYNFRFYFCVCTTLEKYVSIIIYTHIYLKGGKKDLRLIDIRRYPAIL